MIVSEEAIKRYGLKPLAKLLSYHVVAVEPTLMGEFLSSRWGERGLMRSFVGIGPVEAIRGALAKAGLKIEDIDVRRSLASVRNVADLNAAALRRQRGFRCSVAFRAKGAWSPQRQDQRLWWSHRFVPPSAPSPNPAHLALAALGHPLGASGGRITANLVHNLVRLNKRYAVGSACIGGGQGIALVWERC